MDIRKNVDTLMAEFIEDPTRFGFQKADRRLVEQAKGLPVLSYQVTQGRKKLTNVQLITPDGSVVCVLGKPPWTKECTISPVTLRVERELVYTIASRRYPVLDVLMPRKDEGCWTCRYCDGKGEMDDANCNPFWTVQGMGKFCFYCSGKGWHYNPRRELKNPLQNLFEDYWSRWDFDEDYVESEPDAALKKYGLDVGTVNVEIAVTNSEPRDLCWDCQLNEPRFELFLGACTCDLKSAEKSPLSTLITTAQSEPAFREALFADPKQVFRAHGLSVSDNISMNVVDAVAAETPGICPTCNLPRCAIRIVTGSEGNVCCCKDPILFDILYDEASKRSDEG